MGVGRRATRLDCEPTQVTEADYAALAWASAHGQCDGYDPDVREHQGDDAVHARMLSGLGEHYICRTG